MSKRSQKKFLSYTLGTSIATLAIVMACSGEQAKAKPNIVTKDAPKPGVAAKVNGEEITEDQLLGDEKLEYFDLQKKMYDLKMSQLNRLLVEKLIGAEAKKANLSTEEYINKKVLKKEPKVSDSEYKKFVEERHIPESQITPQIKEKINQYILGMKKQDAVENYVAQLTQSNPVEVYFQKPKTQANVEAGDSPYFGSKEAKVTIVEFSDFQCPYCGRAAETVTQIKKKYGNKIKLAFRQFPLPMHPDARPAAEASMCVYEQGADKFWKFHDLAFKNQEKLGGDNLMKLIKDAGADADKAKQCIDSKKYAAYVQKDMEYGEKLGVRSTPTFFINGQLINGARPLSDFSEVIDEELASSKKGA